MYTNKFTSTNNAGLQVISHDGWISMNSLKTLADPVSKKNEENIAPAQEKVVLQRQQSWIEWPSFIGKSSSN